MSTTAIAGKVTNTFNTHGWKITEVKASMLDSDGRARLKKSSGLPDLPEMFFAESLLELQNENIKLSFSAVDALRHIDRSPSAIVQVASSGHWMQKNQKEIEALHTKEPSKHDWTYTTIYKGTLESHQSGSNSLTMEDYEAKVDIPFDEIRESTDDLEFYSSLDLFEDELADNGTSHLSVKCRVMETFYYCLLRFWLRVDDVLFRLYETRVYHKFGSPNMIIEYTEREAPYKIVALSNLSNGGSVTDPDEVSRSLVLKKHLRYSVPTGGQ